MWKNSKKNFSENSVRTSDLLKQKIKETGMMERKNRKRGGREKGKRGKKKRSERVN